MFISEIKSQRNKSFSEVIGFTQWRIKAQANIGCSLGAHTDQGPLIGQKKINK